MTANLDPQDLLAFAPELILCATIVFLLVLRLFNRFNWLHLGTTTRRSLHPSAGVRLRRRAVVGSQVDRPRDR